MKEEFGILGDGAQADELDSYLLNDTKAAFRVVSAKYLNSKSNNPIIDIANPGDYKTKSVIAAVGPPALRKKMVEEWAGKDYVTVIAKDAHVDKSSLIGKGSIIAPGTVITTNVQIGSHNIINIGVTISHDCKVGNFVTISPGANVAGNVEIGDGVFVGIGAVISNGIKIASGSVIGAGAIVIEDVKEENSVVVGNPAKTIKINQNWLNEI